MVVKYLKEKIRNYLCEIGFHKWLYDIQLFKVKFIFPTGVGINRYKYQYNDKHIPYKIRICKYCNKKQRSKWDFTVKLKKWVECNPTIDESRDFKLNRLLSE